MYKFFKILSAIFSPLLAPTYAMLLASYLTILRILPTGTLWGAIGIVFAITAVIPAAGILSLHKAGIVSDTGLNQQSERTIPYIIVILCYAATAFFLFHAHAPRWLPMFMVGAGAATLINIVVNRWWKISAHAAGMGGLVAMLFRVAAEHQAITDLAPWITVAVLLAGLVMTGRVYMGRHTLLQVLAGAANGFLCVWLVSNL